VLVSQPSERFRLFCAARQSVGVVSDYHGCAQPPAGFDHPLLRRLLRAWAGASVIGRATRRDFCEPPIAQVSLLRRLPGFVETCLAQGMPSMEATTTGTLGRPRWASDGGAA
jgi:hypothetical protein